MSFMAILPFAIISQNIPKIDKNAVKAAGGDSIILNELNKKLSTQVNPIVFPAYETKVTDKIMKNQLEKYFPVIKEVVNAVNTQLPGYVVQVTGYGNPPNGADTAEAKETARSLSEKRAQSVKNALVEKGLKEGVLTVRGMGDADRVGATPDNAGAWGKNRRVVMKIVKK